MLFFSQTIETISIFNFLETETINAMELGRANSKKVQG